MGTLTVRVKALDAMRVVTEYEQIGADAHVPTDAPAGPPKPVSQLSAAELHAVLAYRNVPRLPASVREKQYYLELCSRHAVKKVDADELHAACGGTVGAPPTDDARVSLGVEEVLLTPPLPPPHPTPLGVPWHALLTLLPVVPRGMPSSAYSPWRPVA